MISRMQTETKETRKKEKKHTHTHKKKKTIAYKKKEPLMEKKMQGFQCQQRRACFSLLTHILQHQLEAAVRRTVATAYLTHLLQVKP